MATSAAAVPRDAGHDDGVPARYRPLVARAAEEGSVRLLVSASDGAGRDALAASLRRSGVDVVVRYHAFPVVMVQADAEEVRELATDPHVEDLTEDTLLHATLDGTVPLVNADDVHALGVDGSGTAVAVLDSGIDADHPFFSGRVVAEACFSDAAGLLDETSLCPDGSPSQTGTGAADAETPACVVGTANRCFHGSHVTGIAAGDSDGATGAPGDGVAPGAGIVAIQVFTRIETGALCDPEPAPCLRSARSDQLLALQHVLSLQGTLGAPIVAANLSLGGNASTAACDASDAAYTAAIDALLAQNVATVIAAGNDGLQNAVSFPACISNAVAVGATDDGDDPAFFGNRGSLLDLFGPGVDVRSAVPGGGFGALSGTSMAAPHVTGLWALLRQAEPSADVAQVLGALESTGAPITYGAGSGSVTTPRVDAETAHAALTTQANLSASLASSPPGPGRVGSPLSFAFEVANGGPDAAIGVRLGSSAALAGRVTAVDASHGTCRAGGLGFTCALDELAVGETASVTLVVTPTRGGRVRVFAEAAAAAMDPDAADNVAGATVRAKVVCTITGTPGPEVLRGTPGIDVLCGRGGGDVLRGRGDDDILKGGPGADRLVGGGGDDLLLGGGGPDLLKGGPGIDTCRGGGGRNVLRGCDP